MGTNYYHTEDACPTCGKGDEVHIGKSSVGWAFHFNGTEEVRSWQQWKEKLKSGIITNEYGDVVTLKDFIACVEDRQQHRSGTILNHYAYTGGGWCDDEGYSFTDYEFS